MSPPKRSGPRVHRHSDRGERPLVPPNKKRRAVIRTGPRGAPKPFELGLVVATVTVSQAVSGAILAALLQAHQLRQWGRSPVTSHAENERNSRSNKGRISSAHQVGKKTIWIITEGGERGNEPRRTTILFPDDY